MKCYLHKWINRRFETRRTPEMILTEEEYPNQIVCEKCNKPAKMLDREPIKFAGSIVLFWSFIIWIILRSLTSLVRG